MLRSSAIFAGLTLVSRFLGLARDLVITAKLGTSFAGDAYYTALQFPNLFRRMFAEGAFAAAFVPEYSKRLASEGDEAADRYAADALASVAAFTALLTVVCQLAMPWIMRVYSYGFMANPEKFKLAVILTQITMPYLPCVVIASLFAGVLTSRGRFVISGLYPAIQNVVMLVAVLPAPDPLSAAYAASWAAFVSGIMQAALCWWGAHKTGAQIHPRHLRLSPDIIALARRMAPGIAASSVVQINLFISGMLASEVAGMRVWMNVAERFYQLPLSLIGTAIGVALLPRLATSLSKRDAKDVQAAMDQAMVFSLALCLPAGAALMAMPTYLVDGLFTRGNFTSHDATSAATLLFHYGWGLPAFVLIKILQPAFFARGDTKTPMIFSTISVVVNIVLGFTLFRMIGFSGIAIATSIASWITVAQMVVRLYGHEVWRPSARASFKMIRVSAASALMGALVALAAHFRPQIEGALGGFHLSAFGPKEITVLLVAASGGVAYIGLLFVFGGVTPAEARTALKRRKGDKPVETLELP